MSASAETEARVLIVGTGLTGSLTCYHLRGLLKKDVHIDMTDMARGAGGRMSTTRFGDAGTRANTGAQYVSCHSPEALALRETVCGSNGSERECGLDRVDAPERSTCGLDRVDAPERSTYFLEPDSSYTNWLPRQGTNALVKQFLYAGEPDSVVFESRLQRVMASTETGKLLPLFDRGGLQASYSAVVLAMPPKDILKFFAHEDSGRHEPQSQADLHRRTNRGRSAVVAPQGHRHVALPADVQRRLGAPSYVGRYSLALWFDETESETAAFLSRLAEAWRERRGSHPTIDLVSHQPGGVVVVQSTVQFWRRPEAGRPGSPHGASRDAGRGRGRGEGRGGRGGGRGQGKGQGGGGGRDAAKAGLVASLEDLAGGPMPRARNAKLLNWRTSQVDRALPHGGEDGATVDVVTAEGGRLIFTGDWCTESSFEGCNRAALAAAAAAKDILAPLLQQPPPSTQLPTPPVSID